jgi:hypothetical protein
MDVPCIVHLVVRRCNFAPVKLRSPIHGVIVLAAMLIAVVCDVHAQPQLAIGALDVSGWPVVRGSLRATDGGVLITTIDTSRFLVTEEGARRAVTVECGMRRTVAAAVAVGLERSLDAAFPAAKTAAQQFVRRVRYTDLGDASSLWSFATIIDHAVSMGRDSAGMQRELASAGAASFPFNGTPLYEVLSRAVQEVAATRDVANRTVVFFTDGVNNTSYFNTSLDDVQRMAVTAGVRVFAVLITEKPQGVTAMTQLCNATKGFAVPASNPRALDSIAAELHLEALESYWCSFRFRSELCANGATRALRFSWRAPSGDSATAAAAYTAPLHEDELIRIPYVVTPRTVSTAPGDTVWVALGYATDRPGELVPASIELQHVGLARLPGEVLLPPFRSWNVNVSGSVGTILRIAPDPSAIPAGTQAVMRIPYLVVSASPVSVAPVLLRGALDCATLTADDPPRAASIRSDTVFGERMRSVSLPITISTEGLLEGVQTVSFECSLPASMAHLELDAPFTSGDVWPGATLDAMRVTTDTGTERLFVSMSGPPIDGLDTLGAIRVSILPRAAAEIPLRFEAAAVNGFGATVTTARQGLVVLRDSCRNNVVAVDGLFLSAPSPHPAADLLVIDVVSGRECAVGVEVLDMAGLVAVRREGIALARGVNRLRLPVSGLAPGAYVLRLADGTAGTTRRFIIAR